MANNLEDVRYFGWIDYLLFAAILMISSLIGVYHAWKGSSSSTSEYLMGGKSMGIFPVGMSLAASVISAVTMLGTPSDVYLTGCMFWWSPAVSVPLGVLASSFLILPILYKLQVISANQYLEIRFNRVIRQFTTALYVTKQLLYMSIIVYGPSLTLNQVTGIDVYIAVSVMFVVCTFYTTLGGIKAVVWTDAIQIFLMYGAVITVLVKGVMDVGGTDVVWQRNVETSHIEFFNFDPNPTTRHTVWSVVIGGFFFWASFYATDQSTAQRFLAMPTLRKAQIAMVLNIVAVLGIVSLCIYAGLVAHAKYFDCDPLGAKIIEKADQIMPYFVMDTVGNLTGVPGLFVAGVFSGALSSLSTGLNSVALVVLEDFIRPHYPNLRDETATRITKGISIGFGVISFASVFIISKVKTILDATITFHGAAGGSILGVFILGMFVPWANSLGTLIGMIVSFSLMMWLGMASQMVKAQGYVHNQMKYLSIENCPADVLNATSHLNADENEVAFLDGDEVSFLLKVSYFWYPLMAVIIVVSLGTLISLITGPQDPSKLDPELLCSYIRRYFKVTSDQEQRKETISETNQQNKPDGGLKEPHASVSTLESTM